MSSSKRGSESLPACDVTLPWLGVTCRELCGHIPDRRQHSLAQFNAGNLSQSLFAGADRHFLRHGRLAGEPAVEHMQSRACVRGRPRSVLGQWILRLPPERKRICGAKPDCLQGALDEALEKDNARTTQGHVLGACPVANASMKTPRVAS
jgi:hypothetical protein